MNEFTIRFDGGTPCNGVAGRYGVGYGSFQVDSRPIVRVSHERRMSANSAEVWTLVRALEALPVAPERATVLILGDSKIALHRCRKLPKSKFKGKPSSAEFLKACNALFDLCRRLHSFETRWTPRIESVRVFNH